MDWELILENALTAAVGQNAVIYALAAIGLNMHFGYTGLLNFGQVAFVAAGAYGLAISVATFELPFPVGIAIGLLAAVLLALLLGVPTLRLRADYLAIVTIAAGEIVRFVLKSPEFDPTTGGSNGLQNFAGGFFDLNPFGPGEYGVWVVQFNERLTWVLVVGWTLVALSSLLTFLLVRSPWGRVIKAIREDEDAVRSLGKNVYSYKMQSLVLGGIFGALGGFVFAVVNQSVQPDNYGTAFTFFCLHSPAPRRCRPRARPRRGGDDLLVPSPADRRGAAPGHQRRLHPRVRPGGQRGGPGAADARGPRPRAPDDLPPAGHLR